MGFPFHWKYLWTGVLTDRNITGDGNEEVLYGGQRREVGRVEHELLRGPDAPQLVVVDLVTDSDRQDRDASVPAKHQSHHISEQFSGRRSQALHAEAYKHEVWK